MGDIVASMWGAMITIRGDRQSMLARQLRPVLYVFVKATLD